MNTRNFFSSLSKMLYAGLFVLAGAVLGTGTALGQTQDACPLPPGATPSPEPRVTAQQVEDGSASLQDFPWAREINSSVCPQKAYNRRFTSDVISGRTEGPGAPAPPTWCS